MAKTTPLDIIKPSTKWLTKAEAAERMDICHGCPFFTALKTCEKCGCFMPAKTKIAKSECPEGKWSEQ